MKRKRSRSHHRRSNIYIHKTITASLPFIHVDLNLSPQQLSMINNGFQYVIPGQLRFSTRRSSTQILEEQFRTISTIVKSCLKDHYIFTADARAKAAFTALEHRLKDCYLKPWSKRSRRRAQRELSLMRSIQTILYRRPDIVIRRTDKSKVFYIGKLDDFERKAAEYMMKTQAYEEIIDGRCPLADQLQKVQHLLSYLLTNNAITKVLYNRLTPNIGRIELAHYHGMPKPHKVSYSSSFLLLLNVYPFNHVSMNRFLHYLSLVHHFDRLSHRYTHRTPIYQNFSTIY